MIYRIPENWIYNESLEMLYLFYQKADELLSETSPDTYSLPLHLVKDTKDKNKLLYSTTCYFTCLIHLGYSREYVYKLSIRVLMYMR